MMIGAIRFMITFSVNVNRMTPRTYIWFLYCADRIYHTYLTYVCELHPKMNVFLLHDIISYWGLYHVENLRVSYYVILRMVSRRKKDVSCYLETSNPYCIWVRAFWCLFWGAFSLWMTWLWLWRSCHLYCAMQCSDIHAACLPLKWHQNILENAVY